jgi:predicted transcriptional regulator of viral defense system
MVIKVRYNTVEVEKMPIDGVQKYYKTDELRIKEGLSYYKINCLEEKGELKRINKNTYENMNYVGEESDYCTAHAYVPFGVICLMSAARYYELTSFLPDAVDIAIDRSRKATNLPDQPAVNIHYFSSSRMEKGVVEIHEAGSSFSIFDIEKTVADIIYYRNKVGIEETAEVLRNYLDRKDRNIDRLYDYSKKLRCEKILRSYMEVMLV